MRNISFALTTDQIRDRSKTVTRRIGWKTLKPGTLLQPVVKGQGLKKGEKVEKIGGPIRVLNVRREQLRLVGIRYDVLETLREGFPNMTAGEFIAMFCRSHRVKVRSCGSCTAGFTRPCEPTDVVTRIQFEYVEPL